MREYILLSEQETARLRLQAQVWEPEAERMLDEIGVTRGWHCADLGCGVMGILGPLSERVGHEGSVVGVEREPRMLAAAQAYVDSERLENVRLVDADATATALPRASFDLVHARYLLPHAPFQDVFNEIVALAKPGGVVALQEPDNAPWNFYPPNEKWPRLKNILLGFLRQRGVDMDIGPKVYALARAAGLQDIHVRPAVLALQDRHPYMRMPLMAAKGLFDQIVESGWASADELNDLLAELERITNDAETLHITPITLQVWGRRQA